MKKAWTIVFACMFACNGDSKSSTGPAPAIPNAAPNCQTALQGLALNDSLKLTDLDSTTVFIKNNAQQLQKIAPEDAVTVWDCLEQGD